MKVCLLLNNDYDQLDYHIYVFSRNFSIYKEAKTFKQFLMKSFSSCLQRHFAFIFRMNASYLQMPK